MADIADSADGYNERLVADVIAANARQKEIPRGKCLYCDAPVIGVFCNPEEHDCRDRYELRQRQGR